MLGWYGCSLYTFLCSGQYKSECPESVCSYQSPKYITFLYAFARVALPDRCISPFGMTAPIAIAAMRTCTQAFLTFGNIVDYEINERQQSGKRKNRMIIFLCYPFCYPALIWIGLLHSEEPNCWMIQAPKICMHHRSIMVISMQGLARLDIYEALILYQNPPLLYGGVLSAWFFGTGLDYFPYLASAPTINRHWKL